MHDFRNEDTEQKRALLRGCTLFFHACWILILACAAWRRFSLPAEPLTDRDVWGYLSPALAKLSGGPFQQTEGRAFVYPGFVYLVISAFRSLNAITAVQHLLGLGTGLLLLVNWKAARRLLPNPLIPAVWHDIAGLGLFAIFLLCAQSIIAEHHLRPEGIAPFFAMLGFALTIRFLLAKHIDAQPRQALCYGAASLAVAFLLPLLKPSYALSSVLTTLPVWWHLFDRREKGTRRLAMAGVPVVAAWLLLWIPEGRYAAADPRTQTFLPASLFTIHAPQIRAQLASDLDHPDAAVPYPHEQLQSILQLLDAEIEISRPSVRHGFVSLGFNPDYLLYEDSFCRKLAAILPERTAQADFYRLYFRRTWQQKPGLMLHKFAAQLGLFYGLNCPVYEEKVSGFDRNYRDTATFLSGRPATIIAGVPVTANYLAAVQRLAEAHTNATQPRMLKSLLPILARSYLPGLLLAMAAFAWLLAESDIRAACGRFATVVALGYAYNLGNNVSIALFHTLGIGRYSHVQLATTLLTQGLALWLVIEVAARKFRRPDKPPEIASVPV
ncbi:MAG: hypothetical protein ABJF10_16005 [Chthoniobacter sp.]|uniref:hypothetical protein n=1 Tax=Chthoniobacter sp. TaxID=2510640 RepID=UPI0032A41A56